MDKKIDIVEFHPQGDGVTALYVDESLHTYGDHYHNKINDWVNGFLSGMKEAGVECQVGRHTVTIDKEVCRGIMDDGDDPPQEFEDLKAQWKVIAEPEQQEPGDEDGPPPESTLCGDTE